MKHLTYLLGILLLLTSCDDQNLQPNVETLGSIEGESFQLISLQGERLINGTYSATLAGKEMYINVLDGTLRFAIPNVQSGSYQLTWKGTEAQYQLAVHVMASAQISADINALEKVSQELRMGITKAQLLELTNQERLELAQFIEANRTEIERDLMLRERLDAQRTTHAYYALAIGESKTIEVASADYWNASGVFVTAGESYQVTASGTWTDWYIDTDANGYSNWYLNLFTLLKRSKSDKWFKLMGSVNQNTDFAIGTSAILTPNVSGPLDFYANDANGFYWNNYGSVQVTITRVQ